MVRLMLISDSSRIRTWDRLLRRQVLYPAELTNQFVNLNLPSIIFVGSPKYLNFGSANLHLFFLSEKVNTKFFLMVFLKAN